MWQLGTSRNGIPLNDSSALFYGQHNFSQIESGPYKGMYALVSNGNDKHPFFSVNVYDIDEKKLSAKLVRRYVVDSSHRSTGGGTYTWINDIQFICYGYYNPGKDKNQLRSEYACSADSANNVLARYYLPSGLLLYTIYPLALSDWRSALPKRPVITGEKNHLTARSDMPGQVTWYEMQTGKCVKVAEGRQFNPERPGTYVISQQVILGNMVSLPYVYKK